MAALSLLSFLTCWITPTSLFVFLNLVIGTIFITSRFTSTSNGKPQTPLARSHSVLERVRSINFSLYKFPEPQTGFVTPEPDHPTHLQRAPSLLERVRSINFSSLYHHEPEPEPSTESTDHPTHLQRAPSLLERFRSINFSSYHHEPEPEPSTESTDHPTHLQRAPSLLERVRSINLASLYRHEPEPEPEPQQEGDDTRGPGSEHQVKRSKSEPREERQVVVEKIKKSASERAAGTMEDEEEEVERRRPKSASVLEKTVSFGDETVDAKADDFINRFKQHLKLQRLDSILRSHRNAHRELEH